MDTKKVLYIILGLAIIIVVASVALRFYQTSTPSPNAVTEPADTKPIEATPTPTPISKPVPVQITTIRGTVTSVNNTGLTINTNNLTQTYAIAGTKDFQKVVSGTMEKGDVKTIPATASDLKIGQEVLIITDISSKTAKSVYILK